MNRINELSKLIATNEINIAHHEAGKNQLVLKLLALSVELQTKIDELNVSIQESKRMRIEMVRLTRALSTGELKPSDLELPEIPF